MGLYLNYYDYDTFNSVINDLRAKRPKDLYEILIIYNDQFKYPIIKIMIFLTILL